MKCWQQGYFNLRFMKKPLIIKFPEQSLLDHFTEESVDYILCNDFIEHFFHWEAVKILNEFFKISKCNGVLEIRVPDSKYIIYNLFIPLKKKLTLLFGGQDIP